MDYKITWTIASIDNLRTIVNYVSQDSPQAAEQVQLAILETVNLLRQFPLIGSVYKTAKGFIIREVLSGPYRVFYHVHECERRVEILLLWHAAREEPTFG